MQTNPIDVALAFVDRINHHDVSGLVALMSPDHRFVDGLGQEVKGQAQMEKGWSGYLDWFPDYSVKVDDVLSNGNVVALFGTAEGTYAAKAKLGRDAHWKIPAAWKAVVCNGRISEWHVYADNEPVWKIMGVKRH